MFGRLYQGEATDWEGIIQGLNWVRQVVASLNRPIPTELANLMMDPEQLSQLGKSGLESINPVLEKASETVNKLSDVLKSYSIEGGHIRRASFVKLSDWLRPKAKAEDLHDWLEYSSAIENCRKLGLGDFVDAAIENRIPAKSLRDVFMQRLWKSWLAEVYQETPVLAEFTATSHEQTIREFRNLEKKARELTIQIVRQNVAQSQPKAEGPVARDLQMRLLLREAQKKRRIKPLRKLFSEIPNLIQSLKPCARARSGIHFTQSEGH